jgi:hypothetical protein
MEVGDLLVVAFLVLLGLALVVSIVVAGVQTRRKVRQNGERPNGDTTGPS